VKTVPEDQIVAELLAQARRLADEMGQPCSSH